MTIHSNAKKGPLEVLLWSIAFPGFGQLLNKRYIKGLILISMELIINVNANFNTIIMESFNGQINRTLLHANYLWLMFYPCVYFFAIWDAYKDAGGGTKPYAFLPFVFSAYFVTVGLMYAQLSFFGLVMGPVWTPIAFLPLGIITGWILQWTLRRRIEKTRLN